jgi:hypothetical protein
MTGASDTLALLIDGDNASPFITACDKFVYFDVLNANSVEPDARQDVRPAAAAKS